MSRASGSTYILPILIFIFGFCLSSHGVYAFGAGNIPSFAYMEGKAFRHGDIEDVLEDLAKGAGGFALVNLVGKSRKFNGLDIKRVYFGNWLRDYSQAVDIATLKKMPLQTILNLLLVLGFMAHGYATNEFEITEERLGCYLPTEHIDNPKGYGDGEDARKYHPGLRGPVDPRELEIDPRTGMKNYIANESGGWDTSKALIRRLLERCIHLGRQHRSSGNKADQYEAYRLLGTALHTLEDYPAHSNFCELALIKMGYTNVFTHVGDQVRIQAPGGKWVAPIVTGTFGSDDFFHSLLGGASDSLSEASVSDLNKEIDKARSKSSDLSRGGGPGSDPADSLRLLFKSIPGGDGQELSRELDNVQNIRAGATAGGKTPEQMSPKELHANLWAVLVFRDSVAKKISKTIEKIPGLGPMIDKLMDGISVFVFTTIEPFMKPILQSATGGLHSVSAEVIDKHDQYEVFNDPRASDPTHSFLSKDHFNLILNEAAGLVAKVIVVNAVQLVAKAWEDNSVNPRQIIEEITDSLFHPDFHNPSSKVQKEMLQCMADWVNGLHNKQKTIDRLSKESVRNHTHTRGASEASAPVGQGGYAAGQAHQFQGKIGDYAASHIPGGSAIQGIISGTGFGAPSGPARAMPGEASAYFNNAPEGSYNTSARSAPPPVHQPAMPHSPPPFGGGSHHEPPSRPGYSPSYQTPGQPGYAPPSHGPPSFPGGPPSFPGAVTSPSFPGGDFGAPSFPGGPTSPPNFPGGPPSFPGAPGGYDAGYGAPPSFPGGAPSFPGGAPGFPGAEPYGGHGQGHHGQHGHGHGQWGGY